MAIFAVSPGAICQSTAVGNSKDINIRREGPRKGQKAPAFQNVSCSYDGAALYISFVNGEGECELTLTDNASGITSNYYFDSEAPACLMVGELLSASITITTEAGNTYVGEF